jgi:hypothetical protein
MEYLKISGFQKSTKIAEIESFGVNRPYTIYGHFKEKSRAVMTLPSYLRVNKY